MNRILLTFALSVLLVAGCVTQPAPMPQAAPVQAAAVQPAPAAAVSFRATPLLSLFDVAFILKPVVALIRNPHQQ